MAAEHAAIRSIRKIDLQPLLVAACPSFSSDETISLPYLLLGEFAHHLLALHKRNSTGDFPAVIELIERLHLEGDAYVREAATIGLLEGIQNLWMHHRIDPEEFGRFLLHCQQESLGQAQCVLEWKDFDGWCRPMTPANLSA